MSENNKIEEIINKYTITPENIDSKITNGNIVDRWRKFSEREEPNPKKLDMDNYFDVEGVMTPYVRVWFRGLGNGDNEWIEVGGEEGENYSQNNFFESMTIEDNGFLALTLNLIDRTNYRIQRLLELASYSQSKKAAEAKKNSEETKGFLTATAKEEGEEDLSLSLFKENNISTNNLKIRFGYSDVTNINDVNSTKEFFKAVGREAEANSRWVSNKTQYASTEVGDKTVAIGSVNFTNNTQTQPKSYEEEFYIIGFSTQISTAGIKYSIKAISAANLFLNSYKLVQNYSKLVGTPREVMAYFMKTFNEKDVGLKVYWSGGKENARVENFTRKKVANGIIIEKEMGDQTGEEGAKKEDNEELKKSTESLTFLEKVFQRLGFLQDLFSKNIDSSISQENLTGSNNFYTELRQDGLTLDVKNENSETDAADVDRIYDMLTKADVDEILVDDATAEAQKLTSSLVSTSEKAVDSNGNTKDITAKKVIRFKTNVPKVLVPKNFQTTGNNTNTYNSLISYAEKGDTKSFINVIKNNNEKNYIKGVDEVTYNAIQKDYGGSLLYSNEFKSSDKDNIDWRKKNYNFISLWLFELCVKCQEDLDSYKQDNKNDKDKWEGVIKLIIKTIACINKAKSDNADSKKELFKELQEIEEETAKTVENLNKAITNLKSSINAQKQLLEQETKQIEIVLGSERTLQGDGSDSKQLYKSISSIFSSYTSQAPCHYEIKNSSKEVTVKDADGNDRVLTKEESAVPRKMSWACLTDEEDGANGAVVIFYYNSPLKFKKIRKYCWGTGNPNQHCIKDLSVSSSTEFANVLSKTAYATSDNVAVKEQDGNKITAEVTDTNGIYRTVILNENDLIERAKENIYKGSMTILGDPSFKFCERVQPYTLPIYIEVKLQTEQSWFTVDEKKADEKNRDSINQESVITGYYLVSKITHQIDKSGFYTTLEIMKYPGLEKEV